MNRRQFLRTLGGVAGAIVAGPVVLKLAKQAAPVLTPEPLACLSAEAINARFLASSGVFTDIMVDDLVNNTVWYWNKKSLKNLLRGAKNIAVEKPYFP